MGTAGVFILFAGDCIIFGQENNASCEAQNIPSDQVTYLPVSFSMLKCLKCAILRISDELNTNLPFK